MFYGYSIQKTVALMAASGLVGNLTSVVSCLWAALNTTVLPYVIRLVIYHRE